MSFNFDAYAQEGRAFVNKVAQALETNDPAHAARVISAFFHALRERISAEESLHLVSQLPMFLKAVYVDGWKLSQKNYGADTLSEFLDAVRSKCGTSAAKDLGNDLDAERIIRRLIGVLREYSGQGELDDIIAQLPDEVGVLFERTEV